MMRIMTLVATVVSVLALAISGTGLLPVKLVYNGSASAPIGFYWVDNMPAASGDYVLIVPPSSVRNLIETRHYLPPNVPLIKRIAAATGDVVCRIGQRILINGVAIAIARTEDKAGRLLPNWQGCAVLSSRQVLLLQPHPDSFDGRYFGPVDRSRIIGRAVRLQFPLWKRGPE